jgi:hypothetical protein
MLLVKQVLLFAFFVIFCYKSPWVPRETFMKDTNAKLAQMPSKTTKG